MSRDALEKLDPESYPAYPEMLLTEKANEVIGDREDRFLSVREFKSIMRRCEEHYKERGWELPPSRRQMSKIESLSAFHAGRAKTEERVRAAVNLYAAAMLNVKKQRETSRQRPKMKAKG